MSEPAPETCWARLAAHQSGIARAEGLTWSPKGSARQPSPYEKGNHCKGGEPDMHIIPRSKTIRQGL